MGLGFVLRGTTRSGLGVNFPPSAGLSLLPPLLGPGGKLGGGVQSFPLRGEICEGMDGTGAADSSNRNIYFIF